MSSRKRPSLPAASNHGKRLRSTSQHARCHLAEMLPGSIVLHCVAPFLRVDEMAYLHQASKHLQQVTDTDQEAAMQDFHHTKRGYARRERLMTQAVRLCPGLCVWQDWLRVFVWGTGLWLYLSVRGVDETCRLLEKLYHDRIIRSDHGPWAVSANRYAKGRHSKRGILQNYTPDRVQLELMRLATGRGYCRTRMKEVTQHMRQYRPTD